MPLKKFVAPLIALLALSFVLSGCGAQTDTEQNADQGNASEDSDAIHA